VQGVAMAAFREDDAHLYWCPFVRYSGSDEDGSNNRCGDFDGNGLGDEKATWNRCVGSLCACWVVDAPVEKIGHCGLVANSGPVVGL